MKKFYAAANFLAFENTWEVYAFSSKKGRDEFVMDKNGHFDGRNAWMVRSIKKSDIGRLGYIQKPRPFSGEKWLIREFHDNRLDGVVDLLGAVECGCPRTDDLTVY